MSGDEHNPMAALQHPAAPQDVAEALRLLRPLSRDTVTGRAWTHLHDAVKEAGCRHTPDARLGHDDVRCASCTEESWPCPTAVALGITDGP